jgi:hypothetical protein
VHVCHVINGWQICHFSVFCSDIDTCHTLTFEILIMLASHSFCYNVCHVEWTGADNYVAYRKWVALISVWKKVILSIWFSGESGLSKLQYKSVIPVSSNSHCCSSDTQTCHYSDNILLNSEVQPLFTGNKMNWVCKETGCIKLVDILEVP